MGIIGVFFALASAQAVDLVQTGGAGKPVSIATAGNAAAPDVTFNPSTNVIMTGVSVATAFAISGYHDQAVGKSNGQVYGMGSNSNKMFMKDISGGAPTATSSTVIATAFSGWYTM